MQLFKGKLKEDFFILFVLFGALRLYFSIHKFYIYPILSDHYQYLTPLVMGTLNYNLPSAGTNMIDMGWPWFDRLSLAVGLKTALSVLPVANHHAAALYALFVSFTTTMVAFLWVYRNSNYFGAIVFGSLIIVSNLTNVEFAQTLPEATLVMFSLLAFVSFFPDLNDQKKKDLFLAGFFAMLAAFSKATGACVPAFLGVYLLLSENRMKEIPRFALGAVCGTLAVLAGFAFYFGLDGLVQCFNEFIGENIDANINARKGYTNFVSFIEVFYDLVYLPAFAALFVFGGAIKDKATRPAYLYAWTHIAIIYLFYYLSNRGYLPKPRYVMPACFFTIVMTGVYIGRIYNPENTKATLSKVFGMSVLFISTIAIGFYLGETWYPDHLFKPRDIGDYPRLLGTLFGIGPLLTLLLLAAVEAFKTKKLILFTMLFMALLGSSYSLSKASRYINYQQFKSMWFYEKAELLDSLEVGEVDVYVHVWRSKKRFHRMAWPVHIVYEGQYDDEGNPYTSETRKTIRPHSTIDHFRSNNGMAYILSDSPDMIRENLKDGDDVEVHKEIEWKDLKLYVLKRIKKKQA